MNVDNKNIQNNIIKYQSRSIHYNNHNPIMDLSQSKLFNIKINIVQELLINFQLDMMEEGYLL